MKSKFSLLTTAAAAILLSLPLGAIAKEPEHADAPKVSPADAVARLKAGNQRFVAGKLQHPHQDLSGERNWRRASGRSRLSSDAPIPGLRRRCSSTKVWVIYSLFASRAISRRSRPRQHRVCGRSLGRSAHRRSGPPTLFRGSSAKETLDSNGEAPAHINSLVTAIKPAVEATRGADVEATVKANIDDVVEGSLLRPCPEKGG